MYTRKDIEVKISIQKIIPTLKSNKIFKCIDVKGKTFYDHSEELSVLHIKFYEYKNDENILNNLMIAHKY